MAKKLRIDWFMFAIAAGLSLFGAIMVYSASAMISLDKTQNDPEGATQFLYFSKQFGFTLAGLVVMYAASKIDYRIFNQPMVVYGAVVVTCILLAAVFGFPPIKGAQRWIRIGGFSIQPSEIAKVVLPIFLAYFLTKNEKLIGDVRETVVPCLLILGLFGGLIIFEPDLGTTIVLCAIFVTVYFAAGAKIWHLGVVGVGLTALGIILLLIEPFRVKRLLAFLDPCAPENREEAGYQVCQSLMGIGSGGIIGEGFAKGQQKLFYLPEAHNDFIFATVGEELGLLGTLLVVIAFGLLLWRGTRAALLAPDRFGMLLGIGIITGLIVQALFNISVTISIVPAKGIPLPFISYGGSSILVTLAAVGILLNISQYAGFVSVGSRADDEEKPKRKRRNKGLR
jgi:cell division protein FtsW